MKRMKVGGLVAVTIWFGSRFGKFLSLLVLVLALELALFATVRFLWLCPSQQAACKSSQVREVKVGGGQSGSILTKLLPVCL